MGDSLGGSVEPPNTVGKSGEAQGDMGGGKQVQGTLNTLQDYHNENPSYY
jgi:hypothetical protein